MTLKLQALTGHIFNIQLLNLRPKFIGDHKIDKYINVGTFNLLCILKEENMARILNII